MQDDAVKAAREAAAIANNQYKAGTANYLAVVVLQANALNNERTALAILGRRLVASVGLIKALGGGWDATALVQAKELAFVVHHDGADGGGAASAPASAATSVDSRL